MIDVNATDASWLSVVKNLGPFVLSILLVFQMRSSKSGANQTTLDGLSKDLEELAKDVRRMDNIQSSHITTIANLIERGKNTDENVRTLLTRFDTLSGRLERLLGRLEKGD